jgi:hypothetical protein
MNDAQRVVEKYERIAPIVILTAIVGGFLIAGGNLVAVPIVGALGVLIAIIRIKGVRATREALLRRFGGR